MVKTERKEHSLELKYCPTTMALGRQEQEDHESKGNLGYTANSRSV